MPLSYGTGNNRPAQQIGFGVLPGNPQWLVVSSIYNESPGDNVLAAHVFGPPYDGSNSMFFNNIDHGLVFGLNSGCYFEQNEGGAVVFPYVKLDPITGVGSLRAAGFIGQDWFTTTISGPPANDFDSADCDNAGNRLFVSGHDQQQNRFVVYEDTGFNGDYFSFVQAFCVGGSADCLAAGNPQPALKGQFYGALEPQLEILKMIDTSSATVERNPWVMVAQSDTGDLLTTVLDVDPGDTTSARVRGTCTVPGLFTPDGIPALNEMVVVTDPAVYGRDAALGGVVLQNGVRIGAVRHSGDLVRRFGGRVEIPATGDCQIGFTEFDSVATGTLGFQGVGLFPYLTGGNGFMVDQFIETDPDLTITASHDYPDYPGNEADGGPRAGCLLHHNTPPGTQDFFFGASARPDGGLNLFGIWGPTVHRDSFENRLIDAPPITETEAFATCP